MSQASKYGPPKRFDKELRVYVTQEQFEAVEAEAVKEERVTSNMVRVLLNEALRARRVPAAGAGQ